MRIMIHDYAGHPFQAELSRKLASMGHSVDHVFFGGDQGPKGAMSRKPGDPDSIRFFSVDPGGVYSKTNFFRRRQGDLDYGRSVASLVRAEHPDVVISGNTPTEAQDFIVRECVHSGIAFVYWCQDLYSIAATRLLEKRLPIIGHAIGAYYRFLEGRQMRHSDLVINITDVFTAYEKAWGVPGSRIEIIPNWGAIDQLPLTEKQNSWRTEMGLSSAPVLLYSGTLALKHNPRLLIALAAEGSAQVVVLASGVGMEALHAAKAQEGLENLHLLPLQPFERFAEVLGSADVLLAVIEREAGEFSVPSKVLSYLCAGRPIVLAAPAANLAAKMIRDSGAGAVVEPEDEVGFVRAVTGYLLDPDHAQRSGAAARCYAEQNFDLSRVARRFEDVCERAIAHRAAGASRRTGAA